VNRELEALDAFLKDLPSLLGTGARAAIISFHSLEDRAVKHRFRELAGACSCPPRLPVCVCGAGGRYALLTKRPLIADDAEVALNRRARSAKLRALERLEASEAAA
jgi:16S rRNA (cytosine1402-N4)-methyltransferase